MNLSSVQNFEKSIDKETMINICKYGKYYNPASNHYGGSSKNVVCDRCHKNRLDICIGWKLYDLCFKCNEEINTEIKNKLDSRYIITKTNMEQNQFAHNYMTLMMQDQFSNNGKFSTYMMQNQFSNNDTEIRTKMMQDQFSNNGKFSTYMMQNQFSNNDTEIRTKMMQDQFSNNDIEIRTKMMQDQFSNSSNSKINKW
jgi:hypothetical protein